MSSKATQLFKIDKQSRYFESSLINFKNNFSLKSMVKWGYRVIGLDGACVHKITSFFSIVRLPHN